MNTETMENKATENESEWVTARGNLPPLAILEVGQKIEGIVQAVDMSTKVMTKKVKGKVVEEEQERIYYRVQLSTETTVHTGRKQPDGSYIQRSFDIGDVVSLPGSGALDSTFAEIAKALEGKGDEDEADYDQLVGLHIRVERLPNDVMKKGQFQGNPVKAYDVKYKKPKA